MQTKVNNHKNRLKILHILGAFAWAFIFVVMLSHKASAQTFIQSYGAKSSLNEGLIVQLIPNNPNDVEPVSQNNISKTLGVVVNSQDASVAFANASGDNQTFVATTGHYDVLVSDENGPITVGEYVTVSAITGVGMAANTTEPIVVGEALQPFNGSADLLGTTTVTDSNGTKQTVHLGLIDVDVSVAHNPLEQNIEADVPNFLKKLSTGIAGGKVDSPWRIYLGTFIVLATAIVAGTVIYSGVKNGLISIGRNPLSKKTITRSLVKVVLAAVIIFITGLFGVYLLLKV